MAARKLNFTNSNVVKIKPKNYIKIQNNKLEYSKKIMTLKKIQYEKTIT
jgi:hypothetical protein